MAIATAVAAHKAGEMLSSPLLTRVDFGAYAAKEPWPDVSSHYEMEERLEVRLGTMSWFQNWTNGWLAAQSKSAADSRHEIQIAYSPVDESGAPIPFNEVLAGVWDRRLDMFFRGAAKHPFTVTIRMAHEMNLSQQHWSVDNRYPCTSWIHTWVDTWKYVVERQRAIGGNVQWQWCVNSIDMGRTPAEAYWPGVDYVDVLSIDLYNGYGPWTDGAKLLKPMYERVTSLHASAPVWLGELGCRQVFAGESWSKSKWYEDLLSSDEFPRLTKAIFFNIDKEFDWRITEDDVLSPMRRILRKVKR